MRYPMPSHPEPDDRPASAALTEAADVLVSFGAAMLRAGNTASRTCAWIDVLARRLDVDAVSINLSLDAVTATLRRSDAWITVTREVGPPGINTERIVALEKLARTAGPGAPRDIASRLAQIESAPPAHSRVRLAAAIGVASGAFAFLNGAAAPEMAAAGMAGAIGQSLRSWLARRHFNQHGVVALSAVAATGVFALTAALMRHAGFGFAHYPAGFVASALFLVPGFPLIAGLFDLLQHHTLAAVSRLAYGIMMLLALAFGVSIVIEVAGIDVSAQPPLVLAYPLKLLLRAVASFVAAGAFALLFNSSARTAVAAGLLALAANDLRLVLVDLGMMPAPAAFLAALFIGVVAIQASKRLDVPRLAVVVAPIVIMVPGVSAFATIVLFNHGRMLEALQAAATFGFVIGALAFGLATALVFAAKSRAVPRELT